MLTAQEKVNALLVHPNVWICGNTSWHLYIDQEQSYIINYGFSKFVTETEHFTICDWSDTLCIEGPDMFVWTFWREDTISLEWNGEESFLYR